MESIILELLKHPFLHRTSKEQLSIVSAAREFHSQSYETTDDYIWKNIHWLIPCTTFNESFCWSCLLFSDNKGKISWNSDDLCFSDPTLLSKYLHPHETSAEHINAEFQLKMFYKDRLQDVDEKGKIANSLSDESIKKNREAVLVLMDVICDNVFLTPVLNKRDYCSFSNAATYLQLLESSRDYFSGDGKARDDATSLIKQSPEVVHDVITSVARAMRCQIKAEIKKASFVAVILNEHSEVAGNPRFSTVLRYTHDGDVCERFIGFNSSVQKTAPDVFGHILETLQAYNATDKLLAYSVDGMLLTNKELGLLLESLRERFPSTFLIPWCCHDFGTVLLQGLCEIKECNLFFKTMSGLRFYFEKDSRPSSEFNWFLTRKRRNVRFVVESLWCDRYDVVSATLANRRDLLDFFFFDYVIQNTALFRTDEVSYAYGFRRYLKQFQTVFLLCLFARLAGLLSAFSGALKCVEKYLAVVEKETLKKDLEGFKQAGFDSVWQHALRERHDSNLPEVEPYRELFKRIMDNLIDQVQLRLQNQRKLKFNSILWHSTWKQEANIRLWTFWRLIPLLRHYFPTNDIMEELQVLNLNDSVFQNNSIGELFHVLADSNIKEAVPHVFKLAELCYTLPFYGYSSDVPSKYRVIQDWSACRGYSTSNSVQAVLQVEAQLLRSLRTTESFREKVISVCRRINQTVKLR